MRYTNIPVTLGIRIASSVEEIRQCTCYNKGKIPIVIISCAQTLGTSLPWQLNFCTMAPNLWRSSIRHYLGFHCGASEICVLLGSYTA